MASSKSLALIKSKAAVKSAAYLTEPNKVLEAISIYRQLLKEGKDATAEFDVLVRMRRGLAGGEKALKILDGAVLSTFHDTMDDNSFEKLCREKFDVSVQTALKRALVWEAWFSGNFLYTLPEGKNPLELSFRGMELGAELIVAGELTDEKALMLFSPDNGNWMEKREAIRDNTPGIVKRKQKSVPKEKVIQVKPAGDIFCTMGKDTFRVGYLDVTSVDTKVRVIAGQIADFIKQHKGELQE